MDGLGNSIHIKGPDMLIESLPSIRVWIVGVSGATGSIGFVLTGPYLVEYWPGD